MEFSASPALLEFILQVALYLLIAFGVLSLAVAIIASVVFWKGNFSGESAATILGQVDVPKLATIILIILSASFLGLLQVIEGEAVIALLSGIAGYVLGNQVMRSSERKAAE